jgi:hypothetical protein
MGDAGHHVVFDLMFLQKHQAPHHLVKSALPFSIPAITVMDFFRAVQADPDHKIVIFQKPAPPIIQQGAIGLD